MATLVAKGDAPPEAAWKLEYVDWSGPYKDLRFITGATPQEVLLVDDQAPYILPEQRQAWMPISEYAPPYDPADRELLRVQAQLEARFVMGWP